jgi:magnesium-transporting ATPase (P-type)
MIGIVIERGGQNKGSNYWLIVPIVVLFLYSVLFYIFTLFVSYKQKDKINLRVNIFFWWTLIIGFFSFAALLDSIQTETILFSQLIISFSIWTLPLFWWANKYRKNLKLKKQK